MVPCSFGGALMVTNGARFETSEAVITSSAVSTPESAGAAIWLGSCQSNVRAARTCLPRESYQVTA